MRGGEAVYGVVRWRGQPHDWEEEAAGIELEEEMAGAGNGWHTPMRRKWWRTHTAGVRVCTLWA